MSVQQSKSAEAVAFINEGNVVVTVQDTTTTMANEGELNDENVMMVPDHTCFDNNAMTISYLICFWCNWICGRYTTYILIYIY